jgi:AsmA protein
MTRSGMNGVRSAPTTTGLGLPSTSPSWTGELEFSGGAIALPGQHPVSLDDIVLQSTHPTPPSAPRRGKPAPTPPTPARDGFDLQPVSLDLGGESAATLTGHVDDSGYTLHLSGTVLPSRLLAVGKAVPQFGDGLAECLPAPLAADAAAEPSHAAPEESPIPVDLTDTRTWGSPQSWCPAQTAAAVENPSTHPDQPGIH